MNDKGDIGVGTVIISTFIILILILISGFMYEKHMMQVISNNIITSIENSAEATYIALENKYVSDYNIKTNLDLVKETFIYYLRKNLKLNDDLSPKKESIIDGKVIIKDIEATNDDLDEPYISIYLILPIKPHFFRKKILDNLGKEYIDFNIYYKGKFPNNK